MMRRMLSYVYYIDMAIQRGNEVPEGGPENKVNIYKVRLTY